MNFTHRIKNEFDARKGVFDKVSDSMKKLNEQAVKERQAFEGGCREFESLEHLEYNVEQTRKSLKEPGYRELQAMQDNIDSLLEEAFSIDPDKVKELTSGALKLNNLSDNDLMKIAKKHRDNYTALMVIADYATEHESKYAQRLTSALKEYIKVATDSAKRIVGSCENGMNGNTKYPGAWKGFCEGYIEDVRNADDCLQIVIDGGTARFQHQDPIMSALGALATAE